jgi:hypothetical protein
MAAPSNLLQGTLDLLILKTLTLARNTEWPSPAASSRSRAAPSW